ncbi:hypothetical protein GQ457_06G000300 [Hibiscus cannabinus]
MVMVHIHLMLARMVQEFEWTTYPPNSSIDFTGKFEFTVVMKNTLKAIIKPRFASIDGFLNEQNKLRYSDSPMCTQ